MARKQKKKKRKPRTLSRKHRRVRDLQPIASPGDVLHDGEYFVCRVDVPHGRVYDENGDILTGVDLLRYTGRLYTDQEDPAQYKGVRNWFRGPRDKQRYGLATGKAQELRIKRWLDNYEENRSLITRPATDVEPSDVVYLVGSGPSLERNAPELLRVTRGVKVAANWTLSWFADMGMGLDVFDYFTCIDYHIKAQDSRDYPNTTAVMDVVVNPSVPRVNFKDRIWFTSDAQAGNPAAQKAQEENDGLPEYDAGLNVTFSALQWIVMALKAKTIVLVGTDCALTWGRYHCGTWGEYKFWHPAEYAVIEDLYGRPTMSVKGLVDIADWTMGALYFIREAGIRVINASEEGILKNQCELMTLADAVDELNAGGDACISNTTKSRGCDSR